MLEQQYVFILSGYELFVIMFYQLLNHLMTSLHVRPVLYSFCIFIIFSYR